MMVCTGTHAEPVHFNRGRHGHVWICVACGKQLAGPKLPDDERSALVEFVKVSRNTLAERAKAQKENGMKLELGIMAGAESKAWLADLTKVVARMEAAADKITGKKTAAAVLDEAIDEDAADAPAADTESEDEDFAPKKTAKKAKPTFDEDDDAPAAEASEAEDDADDFTTAPPKKAKTPKKITVDDVNDACKAKAKHIGGKPGRDKVLAILMKNFKTESVSDLKPEQYAKCVQLMAV